jgi:hypothetical protein
MHDTVTRALEVPMWGYGVQGCDEFVGDDERVLTVTDTLVTVLHTMSLSVGTPAEGAKHCGPHLDRVSIITRQSQSP